MNTPASPILQEARAPESRGAGHTVPSQLAVDNLTETLAALLDEAMALLGVSDKHTTMANLSLTRIAPEIWHSFPQPVLFVADPHGVPRDSAWKHISTSGQASITIWCNHRGECPDLPENQPAGVAS